MADGGCAMGKVLRFAQDDDNWNLPLYFAANRGGMHGRVVDR
jgi:hypothetical protein